jgi:Flp pilus assembly protein TadG
MKSHRRTPSPIFHRPARRAGAATVEMAIVTPVVILLALGCTDFGRVFHAHSVVSNGARCGAEYGATHGFTPHTQPAWEAMIRSSVEEELRNLPGYDAQAPAVEVSTAPDEAGLYRVAVEVEYPFATTIDWPGLPSQVLLKHRVEMRRIH